MRRKKCGRAKKEAFLFQGHGVPGTLQQYILRLVRLLFIVTLVTLNPSILALIRFALVELLLCDERSGRLHLKRDSREEIHCRPTDGLGHGPSVLVHDARFRDFSLQSVPNLLGSCRFGALCLMDHPAPSSASHHGRL